METLKAVILGIIQGLTEFLPVSSSGHIELGKAFLNFDMGENDLLFTVIVHCATVFSTIVVFRKDILNLLKGLFAFQWNEETQFAAKILLSMIPVGVVGLLFEEQVSAFFDERLVLVGLMLWVTAFLLFLTRYAEKKAEENKGNKVSFSNAILIGLAQAIAVMPGISRSGSTISVGLLLGVDKALIARFSFLMVLPPILGITLLKVKDLAEAPPVDFSVMPMLAGFIAAFISGLLACTWMINLVKKGKLSYFAYYCLIVGAIAMIVGW